jgi:tetratricopeptide (TPR) repeat protein
LPKAVFFLFLRHPEGIIFKYLPDYKEELFQIYKQLSYRETLEEMVRSIDELVNPTKNSINEKCSRIKDAFIRHFQDHIARFYYITGARGNYKSIKIDRQLINWDWDAQLKVKLTQSKTNTEVNELKKTKNEYFSKGFESFGKRDFINAIHYFSLVIDQNQYYFQAFLYRAIAFFNIGEYSKAVEDNNTAIGLNEMAGQPYHNRAEVYLMTKDYHLALKDIDYFIKNFGDDCEQSYFLRGLIKMEMNDLQGACQDWYNAHFLKHPLAKEYLTKYPEIKITNPIFDSAI